MNKFDDIFEKITAQLGLKDQIIRKNFFIGKNNLQCILIYIKGISDEHMIDKDILKPLMILNSEEISFDANISSYLCEKYIPVTNIMITANLDTVIEKLKTGNSALIIDTSTEFILINNKLNISRNVSDPVNESSVRAPREGFVENIDINLSLLKRTVKDKNLACEAFKVGARSQTEVMVLYIKDIADENIFNNLKLRLNSINVDSVTDTGMLEQYLEDNAYSPFPQFFSTERPDIVTSNLMQGRFAIIMNGSPHVITAPTLFSEFFHGIEDFSERTVISTFSRILRFISIFLITTLSPLYLTVISYNVELVPLKLLNPIAASRAGIVLTPFLEIISMEIVVEFLREGGLRLPPRIGQTLSIVGGIIIGNTAVESKVVSPTTLLIIGISVIATFLIPNYQMSLSLRFLRFPLLIIANAVGFLGIAASWFIILVHLYSLECLGVPYFNVHSSDFKDLILRVPLWKMDRRSKSIPNHNPVRQRNFRYIFRRKDNGKN